VTPPTTEDGDDGADRFAELMERVKCAPTRMLLVVMLNKLDVIAGLSRAADRRGDKRSMRAYDDMGCEIGVALQEFLEQYAEANGCDEIAVPDDPEAN